MKSIEILLREDLVVGPEVTARIELLELQRVATPAGARRHQHGYEHVRAEKGRVLRCSRSVARDAVAIEARDADVTVATPSR